MHEYNVQKNKGLKKNAQWSGSGYFIFLPDYFIHIQRKPKF